MGRRVRFRGAKAAPKTLEKDLLEKSKLLAEDPALLMPQCDPSCRGCEIRKAVEKMAKVSENRYNERKLNFSMEWGDQLVRAYAATISLHLAGKVPFLAAARTPMGEISYAVRGKVDRDKLIGVQHYDRPEFRLLAFWKIAEKGGMHIYSTEARAVCRPDSADAPKEYVEEMLDELPYDINDDGRCPHQSDERLVVKWKSAKISVSPCPSCAKASNTVHVLAGRIAASEPTDDFDVEVDDGLKCTSDCSDCKVKGASAVGKSLKERYMKGELTDAALLDEHAKERASRITEGGGQAYMIGSACYGHDLERFLADLRGAEAEKEAISGLARSKRVSLLSRTDQTANLLADLWPQHRDELLAQIASKDVASRVVKEHPDFPPSQLIAEAARAERSKSIESELPTYKSLGPVGAYADRLARTYKTDGKEAAIRAMEKSKSSDHKLRSLSYAYMAALGEGQSRQWQFTREEADFGSYLAPFAERLLASKGQEYSEALKLLLEASGAMEETG